MSHQLLLEIAATAVTIGGDLALEFSRKNLKVSSKSDASLVTKADKLVEQKIISIIKSEFPEHDIYGEESGGSLSSDTYLWIIDPIEGTTNFIHGISNYGSQLAVVYQHQTIISALYEPVSKKLILSSQDQGTTINQQHIVLASQSLHHTTLLFDTGRDKSISNKFLQSDMLNQFRSYRRLGCLITDTIFMCTQPASAYLCFSGKIYDLAPAARALMGAGYAVFDDSFEAWHPLELNHLFACLPEHKEQLISMLQPIIK